MVYSNIIGHQKILRYLQKSFDAGNFSHAYIFSGPSKLGKKTLAIEWIRKRYCLDPGDTDGKCPDCKAALGYTHPNFFVIDPERAEKKEIGIEEIRDLKKKLILTPYGNAAMTAILINDAERLSYEAVSALLKILEEPRPNTHFILITDNIGAVPETICSRSTALSFFPVSEDVIAEYLVKMRLCEEKEARRFARLSFGRPGVAIDMARLGEEHPFFRYRNILDDIAGSTYEERFAQVERLMAAKSELPIDFLEAFTIVVRDMIMRDIGCNELAVSGNLGIRHGVPIRRPGVKLAQLLMRISEVKRALLATNINPRLALEALMLEL